MPLISANKLYIIGVFNLCGNSNKITVLTRFDDVVFGIVCRLRAVPPFRLSSLGELKNISKTHTRNW